MKVDLLEIKSGNDYQKHSTLNKVSAVENWDFGRKIVFCKGNVMEKEGIEYYPLVSEYVLSAGERTGEIYL